MASEKPPLHSLLRRPALSHWLPRALHGLLAKAHAHPAPCGMGLDAMPLGLGSLPVGTPVALAWQNRRQDLLWAQGLLHDLLQHGPVFLLAQSELCVDPLLQLPALAQACAQGRLLVWLMDETMGWPGRSQDLQGAWDEMEQAGLSTQHALLMLASPRVHLGNSVAHVQQWGRHLARWCLGRTRPVVVAFNAWDSAEEITAPLHSLPAVFQHVALLGSHALHPLLLADRWNGSEGPLFEVRLGLRVDAASQRLVYDGSRMQGQTARLVEAPDQHSVIATQAALAGQRGVPAAWQVVAQFTDVAQAAGNAIAATVLLHSGAAAQQEDLLRLVFQLRSQHGRTLKIVVLETQDKLRSNLEQALLNLGANTVVYREVGFARLQRLLDGMCDETYAREIPADYAAARAGFMPDAVRGYLPGTAFCDSVEAMLVRSSSFGLQHCFLRLSMQPHVAHLDAIQACVALRDGDVLSADHNALYVFMFACAEADIEPALARLFSIPPGELFAARTLYTSVDGMRATLRDLREAARNGVPDYSGYRIAPTNPQARGSTGRAPAAQYATLPQPALVQTPPDTGQQSVPPPAPTVYARPLGRRLPAQTQGDPHAA